MARLPRVIAVDVPHHITQRGNGRQDVFDSDGDRYVYLALLDHYARLQQVEIAAYCLMSNHVHLVATPRRPESLPLTMKHTHCRYAAYRNARRTSSGLLWQGRYYSCPLDEGHSWAAMRYVEMNPVRAALVEAASDYPWSSAMTHCGRGATLIDMAPLPAGWSAAGWTAYLHEDDAVAAGEIRRATHTGRPLGSPQFVADLEVRLARPLAPCAGGRPPIAVGVGREGGLFG